METEETLHQKICCLLFEQGGSGFSWFFLFKPHVQDKMVEAILQLLGIHMELYSQSHFFPEIRGIPFLLV